MKKLKVSFVDVLVCAAVLSIFTVIVVSNLIRRGSSPSSPEPVASQPQPTEANAPVVETKPPTTLEKEPEDPKIRRLLLATCNEGPMWAGARICVTDAKGETRCGNLPHKYGESSLYYYALTTTIRAPRHLRDGYTIRIYSVSRGNYTLDESWVTRVDDDGEMEIFFIINNPNCAPSDTLLPVAVVGQEWIWPRDASKWCEKEGEK